LKEKIKKFYSTEIQLKKRTFLDLSA